MRELGIPLASASLLAHIQTARLRVHITWSDCMKRCRRSSRGHVIILLLGLCNARHHREVLELAVEAALEGGSQLPGSHLDCLVKVCNEVLRILDAHGQPNQVRGQRPLLRRDGGMAHGAGHLQEAVDTAKGDGGLEDFARVHQAPREVQRSCGEADHRPAALALRAVDGQTGGVAPPRPRKENLGDVATSQKKVYNAAGVLLSTLHTQKHSLDAAQEKEALERSQCRALCVL
mmetsp:Transcript_129695/g.307645  ORF Transcript_129695/g.307645 Transcript_129695/m.307645 type:complete len:233 (+) Transcript_129695:151-849(+)